MHSLALSRVPGPFNHAPSEIQERIVSLLPDRFVAMDFSLVSMPCLRLSQRARTVLLQDRSIAAFIAATRAGRTDRGSFREMAASTATLPVEVRALTTRLASLCTVLRLVPPAESKEGMAELAGIARRLGFVDGGRQLKKTAVFAVLEGGSLNDFAPHLPEAIDTRDPEQVWALVR